MNEQKILEGLVREWKCEGQWVDCGGWTRAKNESFCAVLLSEQSRMWREDVFDAMVQWQLLRDADVKIATCRHGELDISILGGVITAIVDQYGACEEAVRLADPNLSGKVGNLGHQKGWIAAE